MRKFIGFLSLFLLSFSAVASHVVGGNIQVEQTAANDFLVTLSVFRDCDGAIDPDGDITIYEQGTNNYVTNLTLPQIDSMVVPLGDSCYTPSGLCVESWTFQGTVNLANNSNGYYVVWATCCRNGGITNLSTPTSEGSLFYTDFPDPALAGMNNTPVFGGFPTNGYFCVDYNLDITSTVYDPDGDSLVFSLVTPYNDVNLTKPFSQVVWETGFSVANIVGNVVNPPMSIDPNTGVITVNPEAIGVFVFSIIVEEYRNGVKIGETVRDVQYESLNCSLDSPPVIDISDTVVVYAGDNICVDLKVVDGDGTDTIYATPTSTDFDLTGNYVLPTQVGTEWYYDNWNNSGAADSMYHFIPSIGSNQYEGLGEINLRYCWDPGCENVDETYHINLLAYSLGCSGSDTAQKQIVFDVQYAPTPISLDLPSSIDAKYDTEICFEIFANDENITDLPMSLAPTNTVIDFAGSYIAPSQDANGYYYTNFSGFDTLYLRDYSMNGLTINGKDTLAIRYCWTPQCGDVVLENYTLDFRASIFGECNTVSQDQSMSVAIDPPVGEVRPIPNVFTPNGDNENDLFTLSGSNDPCFDVMEVVIFNRWGKKVFESSDPLFEWNGTNKNDGRDCSEGTYYVLIKGSYGSTYDATTGTRIPNAIEEKYTIQLLR